MVTSSGGQLVDVLRLPLYRLWDLVSNCGKVSPEAVYKRCECLRLSEVHIVVVNIGKLRKILLIYSL